MADITVTATNVRPLNGAIVRRYNAGAALNAGDIVYVATDGDIEQADADAQASAQARGIVVADSYGNTSFSAGQRVDVVVAGPVTGFASMTPGSALWVSTTAGKLMDAAPAGASGDYPFIPGYAESATVFFVQPEMGVPSAA